MNWDKDDEEDEKRRNHPFEDLFGFGSFEKEFSKMQKLADEMMRRSQKDLEKRPFVYGFSVRSGPNGMPKIREFGNAKDYFVKDDEKTGWTPLTDVQETEDEILVTADLPGVEKEDINLEVRDRKLILDVDGARRYSTDIDLPSTVEAGEADATYNNGVLEVKLKRREEEEKGETIEIK